MATDDKGEVIARLVMTWGQRQASGEQVHNWCHTASIYVRLKHSSTSKSNFLRYWFAEIKISHIFFFVLP